MENSDFHEIIKKYLSGQASAEEKRMIDEWYDSLGMHADTSQDDHNKELEMRYWTGIEQHIRQHRMPAPVEPVPLPADTGGTRTTRRLWYAAAAASVLAAVFAVFYMIRTTPPQKDMAAGKVQMPASPRHVIAEDGRRRIVLPDGSAVTLEANSTLRLSPVFNASAREVYLDGEGFFEVAADKQRPFIVYANRLMTKVLGTSFTVSCSQKEKTVSVAVRTGKVFVCTTSRDKRSARREIILTPNQQVIYDQDKDK
ncbi:MAG: FecR domain-containing protein, partial [Bacteroidetes bacterium]|nr:FecR domain-containing protein [Bacteroidota bacterium]